MNNDVNKTEEDFEVGIGEVAPFSFTESNSEVYVGFDLSEVDHIVRKTRVMGISTDPDNLKSQLISCKDITAENKALTEENNDLRAINADLETKIMELTNINLRIRQELFKRVVGSINEYERELGL